MKPGLHIGQTAEIEVMVTPDMAAAFEGQRIHPLYSTSSLVHHMELVARKTLLPFLEKHEEGMGTHVEVHHSVLTPIGMKVKLRATVSAIRDTKIECEVEASNWRGKVAKGIVIQSVIQKSWLDQKIKEMEVVDGIVREQSVR
jgi:fluoroacetyl-CoA thioesterase